MTLDQLRIFVAVAEHGHVTRAARDIGLTQSAVSAALAALEQRYGVRLFDRVGRGIKLTETGRLFLREARAVIERANSAKSMLEELAVNERELARGTVSIAASHTIASYWLPRRLTTFHAAHPQVRLNVVIGDTWEVETAVLQGTVDLGLVEGPAKHPALVRQHVDTDQLVLVVAADQPPLPLRANGELDIASVSWIIREEGSGTRRVLEDLAAREGLSIDDLRVFLVLPGREAVREAVEAGAGATIISRHIVASAIAAGTLSAIPMALPPREFALLYQRERQLNVAQERLIAHLTSKALTQEDGSTIDQRYEASKQEEG